MTLRRAGGRWRLLVHEYEGRREDGCKYGTSHHVQPAPDRRSADSEHSRTHVLPGTEFDELVVGHWLHVEQMNDSLWWAKIGGLVVNITVDRDGRPKSVMHYVEPQDGVTYAEDEAS
jgi:hypothetical protein